MPFPLHDGGALSIYNTAMGLIAQNADLKVLALNTPKSWVAPEIIPIDFKEETRFESAKVDTRAKITNAIANLFSNKSYFVERFYSKDFDNQLIRILQEEKFDIVHLEHVYMCLYLGTIRRFSKAGIVLRPQNVESRVWDRFLKNKINPIKKTYLKLANKRLLVFEKTMAGKVDGIIAISPEDARSFRSWANETPVIDIPMGFDFEMLKSYNLEQQYNDFPIFYHLGSMDWQPNVQGIKWFIEDIVPFVTKQFPGFRFRIAGKKMPEWFFKQQSNNLIVDGDIPDSLEYQLDKAVMIVPLLSGGGIRIKIIEGMALGKTIISTSIGVEGIPYTDGINILIANNKEEFITQIGKCLHSKELCKEIGGNASLLAKDNFDFNMTASKMMGFYKNL